MIASPARTAEPSTIASSATSPIALPASSIPLTTSPTWAISPPGISMPESSAPRRRPWPIAPQISGFAVRQRMKSTRAIGSAPTQTRSLTFIAMQSIPIVS